MNITRCSFCERHNGDVPIMYTSENGKAAICSICCVTGFTDLSEHTVTMGVDVQKEQVVCNSHERWTIDIDSNRFLFRREINGIINESYPPVEPDVAALYAIAIIHGFEPPRHLREKDAGFIADQARHPDTGSQSQPDLSHQDKPTD